MTNLETEPAPLPPPTPSTNPARDQRWARSDDRIVLGVAGGLGRALAIDPLVIRIAFVVLGLFSGVGILAYVAALALLADSPTSPPPSTVRRIGGIIAAVVAMTWLFNGGASLPDAGWVLAIGLLGVAVALWRGRSPVETRSLPPIADLAVDADTAESSDRAAAGGGSTTDRWNSLTARRRDRPRPPRSALGLLTLGAAAVVGALVWLIAGDAHNRGALTFGWATIVIGIGLLVGTFAGKARWLILPAAATTIAAMTASALSFSGAGLSHHLGDQSVFIGANSAVDAVYRAGIGDFELIIADYPDDLSTEVDVGVGNLTVVVPDDARVEVDARVGIGEINLLGSTRSGYRRTLTIDDNPTGSPTITLKLHLGVGNIDVRRGSFVSPPFPTAPAPLIPDIATRQFYGDGTVLFADGSISFGDGQRIEADGTYQIPIVEQRPDGSVRLENDAVVDVDGTVVSPGGFVIPRPPTARPIATLPVLPTINPPTPATATTTTEVQP